MKIAGYSIELFQHGFLRLDGGSMFGSVPRPLWSRLIVPDEKHRIELGTRSLLLRKDKHVILVDVGCGDKWSAKERAIYNFQPPDENSSVLDPDEVTDIIITHLHFDHAGGLTKQTGKDTLELVYPNAKIWLQKSNFEVAKNPSLRERASYLPSHIEPLSRANLELVDGSNEILPGLYVHRSDGHTTGLQYVELRDKQNVLYYPSDLIPTAHHLPLPYHMGYDMCAATLLNEKEQFLSKALSENALLVFEHDKDTAAVRIGMNERGHYAVNERVELDDTSSS